MSNLRRVATLPQQSITAMKVAFGVRAQYATILALSLFMVTQMIGVVVFSGSVRAANNTAQVATYPATYDYNGYFTQQYRRFILRGTFVPATDVTERGFEYGTTTDYGQQIVDAANPHSYSLLMEWDESITGYTSGTYSSIALDSDGNNYVLNGDRIQKFSESGNHLLQWNVGSDVTDITVDIDDNILVLYNRSFGDPSPVVMKYSSSGSYISGWGSVGFSDGQMFNPCGIVVDSAGFVYTSQCAGSNNAKIQKFQSNGTFVTVFGHHGNGDEQLFSPDIQAIASNGDVYIIDRLNNQLTTDKIIRFNSSGVYQEAWSNFGSSSQGVPVQPRALALDGNDNLYVVVENAANGLSLKKYDTSYNLISQSQSYGSGDLAVNATPGTIYMTAYESVAVYAPSIDVMLTATCGMTYHFRAYAINNVGTSYGEDQVFTSFACPVIDTASLVDGIEGDDYSEQIEVTHDANYYPSQTTTYTITSGSLPAGLTLDANTGSISGTPTLDSAGAYTPTITAEDWLGTTSKTFNLTVTGDPDVIPPVDPEEPTPEEPIPEDQAPAEEPESPTITDVTPATPTTLVPASTPFKAPQTVVAAENNIFALAKRIPEPFAIGFPWLLLLLALILVAIQYYQVHTESTATKRMQASVANQERLVDEQNNFVALSTHYLHTPLTVMEGEISLMVKAGTITQAQATKLKATLTSLNAEAEATLAQEEQDKVE